MSNIWPYLKMENIKKRIGIIGGGPAALFMYKRLIEGFDNDFEIEIFERKSRLGAGMPYSLDGSGIEHVTNVSGNEIPDLVNTVSEWIQNVSFNVLVAFNIDRENLNEYKVLPRLLFGQYLEDQFTLMLNKAKDAGIVTKIHFNTHIVDVIDDVMHGTVKLHSGIGDIHRFDRVIICTGHVWPQTQSGLVPGYFDSPYPPAKIALKLNNRIALRGSSLTAVDAARTLARSNGDFKKDENGVLKYNIHKGSENFRMVMHTRSGLLPAVRFHLEDSHLKNGSLLTEEDIAAHRNANGGFLSLDYIFERNFKDIIKDTDPEFYERIGHLDMEGFVAEMMLLRERLDPFVLLRAEYIEAKKSIKRQESIFWKEMLAVLSFAMNYPAKYFSAEDMIRLKGTLMPLISIVIAFIPQTSCRELLALHAEGRLEIVAVGEHSEIETVPDGGIIYHYINEEGISKKEYFPTFVDCIGQPHLQYEDFPFPGLVENKIISPARLKFRNPESGAALLANGDKNVQLFNDGYYLRVPGIGINDNFQVLDQFGAYSERIYIMAVPYIGGYNPDYSGLDFAEAASGKILSALNKASG